MKVQFSRIKKTDPQLAVWAVLGILLISFCFSWVLFSAYVSRLEEVTEGHSLAEYMNASIAAESPSFRYCSIVSFVSVQSSDTLSSSYKISVCVPKYFDVSPAAGTKSSMVLSKLKMSSSLAVPVISSLTRR